MNGLYEWIRNLVGYLVFMTMIMHLLPDQKYEKYIRLFAGAVLILLTFDPLTRVGNLEEQIAGAFEQMTFQNEISLLQREMESMDGRQMDRLTEAYLETARENIKRLVVEQGLSCHCTDIVIDTDTESEHFGNVLKVEVHLIAETEDRKELRMEINRKISTLKKKIGEYYGVEEAYIAVILENGER